MTNIILSGCNGKMGQVIARLLSQDDDAKVIFGYDINTEMYINSYYCPLMEQWVQDTPWEDIAKQVDSSEGDIVRIFKRVVDVLRQLTILPNLSEELKANAKIAIQVILKEPVDVD